MSMRLLLRLVEEAGLRGDVGATRCSLNPRGRGRSVDGCIHDTVAEMQAKFARGASTRCARESMSVAVRDPREAPLERLIRVCQLREAPERAQLLRHARDALVDKF